MAIEIFAKLGDIKGESTDAGHQDEIDVLSFSWGVANSRGPAPGGGAGAGKPVFQDLSIVHYVDKASPKLMAACATGRRLPEATMTHRKAGPRQPEYLIVKLTDVIVTSVLQTGAAAASERPTETVSLAFLKVSFAYRPQKPDGTLDTAVKFKYDLTTNTGG